jgi:hypothetical protein
MEPSQDRSSDAVRVWMPLAVVAAAIALVIAFVMRVPQEQTILAAGISAIIVFSGLLFRSFGKDKARYRK